MPLRYATPAAAAYGSPLTIRHLLDSALLTAADQQIVYRDQVAHDYGTFFDRIGRLASALTALGVDRGATVGILDWDSHRYLECYFAVPMMGAVMLTVNVRLPAPQVEYTLKHSDAEVLLVHRDFLPLVETLLPGLPKVKAVIVITDGKPGVLPARTCGEYEALLAEAAPDFAFEDFDEDAVATMFYTTGTTGLPKGVWFTHRQIVLHTLAATGPFGSTGRSALLGQGDVYMPLTPMFHVHAWGMPYIATLLGLKQVYPGRYDPGLICDLRRHHGVTYSHGVPTVLRMVLGEAERTGESLEGWRMTIGGSAMSAELRNAALAQGVDVRAGYGMSETCPVVTLAGPEDVDGVVPPDLFTAAGTPIPLVSARIVDDAMNPLPHDGHSRGELVLRAPWLTGGYVGDAAASEALWRGGWLHTQDVATIDPSGVVRIRDRLKDVIKSGGEWIDSIQLENLVATADGIAEASVIAVPDARWGERPLAVVALLPGARSDLSAVNRVVGAAIARGEITPYAKLDRLAIVGELPRTSVGKIDKKALRARFGGDAAELSAPDAVALPSSPTELSA